MISCIRVSLFLATLTFCFLSPDEILAKGGRGGGGPKGGGRGGFHGGSNHPGRGGGKSAAGRVDRFQNVPARNQFNTRNMADRSISGGDHPWSKHYAREQRKLDHRRQVADHLRNVGEMNGNDQLSQVADDMDRRAQSHFEKQMEQISQKYGLDDGAAGDALNRVADDPLGDAGDAFHDAQRELGEAPDKLTGRENALYRQLRNEQRKLAKRTEAVERLRQLAQQNGDQGLFDAADQLEQWANDHFDQRMEQITDFQDRHNLLEVGDFVSQ